LRFAESKQVLNPPEGAYYKVLAICRISGAVVIEGLNLRIFIMGWEKEQVRVFNMGRNENGPTATRLGWQQDRSLKWFSIY